MPVTRTGVGAWVGGGVARLDISGVDVGTSISLAANPTCSALVTNHTADRTPNAKREADINLLGGIFYARDTVTIEWLAYRQHIEQF